MQRNAPESLAAIAGSHPGRDGRASAVYGVVDLNQSECWACGQGSAQWRFAELERRIEELPILVPHRFRGFH